MRARWPVVGERVSGGLYCVETGQGEWQECQSGKDQAGDRSSGAAGFEAEMKQMRCPLETDLCRLADCPGEGQLLQLRTSVRRVGRFSGSHLVSFPTHQTA